MPADATTGPSVVVVNVKSVAEERDRRAREELARAAGSPLRQLSFTGVSLTVPYTLRVVTLEENRSRVETLLSGVFQECDMILNDYNPKSEVSAINAAAEGSEHRLSPWLAAVIDAAVRVTRTSGGAFDVAAKPIADFLVDYALKHDDKAPSMNSDPEAYAVLEGLLQTCQFHNAFVLSHHSGTGVVTLKKKLGDAKLCMGGISKGATIDRVIDVLAQNGMTNAMFEWGGDAKGVGRNQTGDLWRVGILAPPSLQALASGAKPEERYLRVCTLDNEAIATSGDGENRVRATSLLTKTYDVKHLCLLRASPINIAQASVKNPSCMCADALATAAFAKREFRLARWMLDSWRYVRNPVTDFTLYVREGEKVAVMHEIASESPAMKAERIKLAIPARVVVVGGGLAGCAAAIEAARCGASVVLIEKMKTLGGNSAKATSGMNAWGTRPQGALDIVDDAKYFERDTFLSGKGGNCDPALVRMLSVKSAESMHWVMKETGLPLTTLSQLGGHSRKRTHRAPDNKDGTPVPIGFTIMKHLIKVVKEGFGGRITVMANTAVTDITHSTSMEPDESKRVRVHGIRYRNNETGEEDELVADSVVLTTGGFANDHSESSLLKEFVPHLAQTPTTNGAWATGDGVKIARRLGATLMDMDKVQLHPTGFIHPKFPKSPSKFLGPEALRGSGGILLHPGKGTRFTNELGLRSVVSAAINGLGVEYPGSEGCNFAYCVLNDEAKKLFGPAQLGFYKDKIGLFQEAKDTAELAKIVGCDELSVVATLKQYAASATSGRCELTGKGVFPCVIGAQGPFYVAAITPCIHYTMGGIAINTAAEVMSNDSSRVWLFGKRKPIQGLFAAGEASAGVHGGNRLGGNSLLECVVFGRIAGDRAATILQRKREALSFDDWTCVVLREINEGEQFGQGSRILRFNLPGALQVSGLSVGQFVAIRGEFDGQQLVGYYSPISLPNDVGVISILARVDKGNLREWIAALRPGDAVHMRACGGLAIQRVPGMKEFQFNGAPIRRIGLVAGGTGIAPMLQILRAATKKPYVDGIQSINMVYAAETAEEITYQRVLGEFEEASQKKFHCHFVVNNPPPGWTQGVGFIDGPVLREHLPPPSDDLLIAICGPPVMQNIVKRALFRMGHDPSRVRTVDETNDAVSKL